MKVENIAITHGYQMHELGKESGYRTALHHVEMWAIMNDLMNKALFDELARLNASYKTLGKEKEEVHGTNG